MEKICGWNDCRRPTNAFSPMYPSDALLGATYTFCSKACGDRFERLRPPKWRLNLNRVLRDLTGLIIIAIFVIGLLAPSLWISATLQLI